MLDFGNHVIAQIEKKKKKKEKTIVFQIAVAALRCWQSANHFVVGVTAFVPRGATIVRLFRPCLATRVRKSMITIKEIYFWIDVHIERL